MIWNDFTYYALVSVLLWSAGTAMLYLKASRILSQGIIVSGMVVFSLFISLLWREQGYPPLRTIGETRLWYSLFILITGFITYRRWKYKWLMGYSVMVSTVFILINILKPEIHFVNLMPALQSKWFIPHVTVYIISYALMGAATITALAAFIKHKSSLSARDPLVLLTDNLVYTGFAFLIAGILLGALWAKDAWGDFWTWDPKEVWAFITAAAYLLYIHCRVARYKINYTILLIPLALILLIITWLGVEYLPAAQDSIHNY